MDRKFISDLKDKEQVDACFMLNKKNLRLTKYDKPYLELGLSDKTGKIEGRVWENAEQLNALVDTGDVVRVKGLVEKFREDKQLKVQAIDKADDRAFSYEDLVRVVENRDKILQDTLEYLKTIKNKWLLLLAESFTGDDDLMNGFSEGVGGKSWHNAYIGGLMEHTFEVMYIADKMCGLYPEADRDVCIFGAFMHDIGKVFEIDAKRMEYTTEGGLVGHIAIGHKILMEKIRGIDGFPEDLSLRVQHIVLSHHGEYEQQSPVLPKTLEATIVYQTDELVSQANAIKEIMLSQSGEGRVWSNFVSIKNRKYYIKDPGEEGWKGGSTPADPVIESDESADLF